MALILAIVLFANTTLQAACSVLRPDDALVYLTIATVSFLMGLAALISARKARS